MPTHQWGGSTLSICKLEVQATKGVKTSKQATKSEVMEDFDLSTLVA